MAELEQKALQLAVRYGPVSDMLILARRLGVLVVTAPRTLALAGVSFPKTGKPTIWAHPVLQNGLERFALAHELAHVLLHSNVIENHTDSKFGGTMGCDEATEFALYLLVPEEQLQAAIAADAFIDEYKLATRFGITPGFMRLRLGF